MHKVALLRAKVSTLYKSNEDLSKRQRAKNTHVRLRGLLTIQEAEDLLSRSAGKPLSPSHELVRGPGQPSHPPALV
jgi:hypothetical protein